MYNGRLTREYRRGWPYTARGDGRAAALSTPPLAFGTLGMDAMTPDAAARVRWSFEQVFRARAATHALGRRIVG